MSEELTVRQHCIQANRLFVEAGDKFGIKLELIDVGSYDCSGDGDPMILAMAKAILNTARIAAAAAGISS